MLSAFSSLISSQFFNVSEKFRAIGVFSDGFSASLPALKTHRPPQLAMSISEATSVSISKNWSISTSNRSHMSSASVSTLLNPFLIEKPLVEIFLNYQVYSHMYEHENCTGCYTTFCNPVQTSHHFLFGSRANIVNIGD